MGISYVRRLLRFHTAQTEMQNVQMKVGPYNVVKLNGGLERQRFIGRLFNIIIFIF